LLKDRDNGKMLEYSPVKILKDTFNHYTADFPPRHSNTGVVVADVCDDLTNSQFKDNEFDTVVCSHVLDAILNEDKAIKELHRITKDTALIAFPMFDMDKTIEYGKLLPENYNHFRKPGKDYIKRFNLFDKVTIVSSHKEENKYGLQGEYIAICQKYNN
jgi:ubiquinone/menaquinone biosynthesis C-methylase UbiE